METKTLSLHHIIKEPTTKKDKTPVLFMFHGYGSDANDLFSFAPELQDELCIISVQAPYPMQPLGFSQGTILSYAVALSYPEKVKNVIALSGYLNEAILKEGYKEKDFTNLNLYCSHGSVDQVIPIDWARKAPVKLKELEIHTVLQEFPVGHGVAPQNFYQFKDWLDKHL